MVYLADPAYVLVGGVYVYVAQLFLGGRGSRGLFFLPLLLRSVLLFFSHVHLSLKPWV